MLGLEILHAAHHVLVVVPDVSFILVSVIPDDTATDSVGSYMHVSDLLRILVMYYYVSDLLERTELTN